jgi:Methyltransferase domain
VAGVATTSYEAGAGVMSSAGEEEAAGTQRRLLSRVISPALPTMWNWSLGLVYGFATGPWPPMRFPPGHYHSTLPSLDDIERYRQVAPVRLRSLDLPGIDLRLDEQLALLDELKPLIDTHPFGWTAAPGRHYRFGNGWFDGADAVLLNVLLRKLEPKRIIEVGSGWSTAAMLDTYADRTLPEVTLIEPHPERLFDTIPASDVDRVTFLRNGLQDVPVDTFEQLGANDILFIDSTHVAKLGSDVNYLVFEILPRLASGVCIHIHDMFFPFEYPIDWVDDGWGWNEAYLLRAFLECNPRFEILAWNDLLKSVCEAVLREKYPVLADHPGGSFWLRKIA